MSKRFLCNTKHTITIVRIKQSMNYNSSFINLETKLASIQTRILDHSYHSTLPGNVALGSKGQLVVKSQDTLTIDLPF